MSLIAASQILLWLVILALTVAVLALARQIGVLHQRIAPIGALVPARGPQIGDRVPPLNLRLIGGGAVDLAAPLAPGAAGRLLLFVSAACPICKTLIPIALDFRRTERLELVFVGDAPLSEQEALIRRFGLSGEAFANGPEIGMAFSVGQLPFAVLIDGEGKIAAKGLVNSREHLESLVVSKETGFPSIQNYVATKAAARR